MERNCLLELRIYWDVNQARLFFNGVFTESVSLELDLVVHEDEELIAQELGDLLRRLTVVLTVALDQLDVHEPRRMRVIIAMDVHVFLVNTLEFLLIRLDLRYSSRL